MIVSNSLYPSEEQIKAFLESDFSGPVCMLNLLKFREKAVYEDGRETNLSGQEAYGLYVGQMVPFVISKGGRFVFSGRVAQLMIGTVEDAWDSAGIVEYPSKEDFVDILMDPQVAGFGIHRAAGLEGQLLVAVSEAPLRG